MPNNQDVLRQLLDVHKTMKCLGVALHEVSGGAMGAEPPSEFRIHNWKSRGIPPAWRYWFVQLAKRDGIEIDEASFMRGEVAA
jgi:hypothetical protein